MTDGQKKFLIILLGIAVVVAAIVFVIKPANDSIKSLQVQKTEKQAVLDDLIEKEKHKDELIAETTEFNEKFDAELQNYPADLNQETAVMFAKSVEVQTDDGVLHDSFAMPAESDYYILGTGTLSEEQAEYAYEQEEGEEQYKCQVVSYGDEFKGTYEGLKDYLKYVLDYKFRMNISTLDMTYNTDTEELSGKVTLNAYSISGPDRTPEKVTVDLPTGTDNLFYPGDGSLGKPGAVGGYDADNGASIATKNTLIMLLNDSESDLSSGVIIASDANSDDTYLTASSNEVAKLTITVSEQDGKNYVEYSMGGSSKKVEVLSKDVAIYVKSSARTSDDDKNGVDVTINNTTDLPVYFKVDGDDSSSPRFNISSRTGTVKVY